MLSVAAFGIPSESPDASLLLAWLTRNAAAPMGLLLLLPGDAPPSVLAHLAHLLQRLLKVWEDQWLSAVNVPSVHPSLTEHAEYLWCVSKSSMKGAGASYLERGCAGGAAEALSTLSVTVHAGSLSYVMSHVSS